MTRDAASRQNIDPQEVEGGAVWSGVSECQPQSPVGGRAGYAFSH